MRPQGADLSHRSSRFDILSTVFVAVPRLPGRYSRSAANLRSKISSARSCAPARQICQLWISLTHSRTLKASSARLCVCMLPYPALIVRPWTMRRSHCKNLLRTNTGFCKVLSGADSHISVPRAMNVADSQAGVLKGLLKATRWSSRFVC